jgi:hypothetical protein
MIVLTKKQINDMLNESVDESIQKVGLITEMAIPLKDYRQRVNALRFQLVENWCLCKYCSLFDKGNQNYRHWLIELRACINNLKLIDIKGKVEKSRVLSSMLIKDYDYAMPSMIKRITADKFDIEGIDDEMQINQVCQAFAKGINNLIEVISNNTIKTVTYLRTTFELE